MDLTVKGMSCVECLHEITKQLKKFSVIEKSTINIDKKEAVFQGYTSVPQVQFLQTLSDTPYFLRKASEAINCQCCPEFYFSFS